VNIKFHTFANAETGYANHATEFWSRLQKMHDGVGVPIHIVLEVSGHPLFYEEYAGIKICYNVYESTLQPESFFNHIRDNWHYFWCPSEWQRKCTIEQGFPEDRVYVVPEGVDGNAFFPVSNSALADKFTFAIFGKWEYRKSTEEMVKCWLDEFPQSKYPDVRLLLSADNQFDKINSQKKLREIERLNDSRITILHFPPRDQYIKLLQSSHCFLSCSRSEGWNLPLIEALACGIPSICSNNSAQVDFAKNIAYMVDTKHLIYPIPTGFPGCYYEPDFEQFRFYMKYIYENWDECRRRALIGSDYIRTKFSWDCAVETAKLHLLEISERHKNFKRGQFEIPIKDSIRVSFEDGARFEISGNRNVTYEVRFIDSSDKSVKYRSTLRAISKSAVYWASPSAKYFVPWRIEAESIRGSSNHETFSHDLDLKDRRVFISFESKALGDNIAWMPFVDVFRQKWGCEIVVSTFWNQLFSAVYPEIEFVQPGVSVGNLYAHYKVGCFDNDHNRNKENWREIPLQKVAADILGLPYREIRPRIAVTQSIPWAGRRYVCVSEHSTMKAKYWNYPGGWQEIVEYLLDLGYDVVFVSKSPPTLKKILPVFNRPIEEIVPIIKNCEFFIGLGSGLSWLSWALEKKVIMISGFSEPFFEFIQDNYRISPPPGVCHGCFNDTKLKFNRDWEWCPRNKSFECSKLITPEMVKQKIDLLISHISQGL